MSVRRVLLLAAAPLFLTACYHATVETGLTPGPQTFEDKWADGWVVGLVPPSTVEAMEGCTSGVARVETQLSFLNQLVGFLTIGIYTPMEIVVTCAAGGGDDGQAPVPESTGDSGLTPVSNEAEFMAALEAGGSFLVRVR